MEKKLSGLVLFLVLLVTYEFAMMQVEARVCLAKSKKYRGRCYFGSHRRNCKTICKHREGFLAGICKRGVCMCSTKCRTNLPYTPPISPPSEGGDGNSPGTGDEGNNPGAGENPGRRVGNNTDDGDNNNPGSGDNNSPGGGDDGGNNSGGDAGTTPIGGAGNTPTSGIGGRTCMSKSKKFRGYCYLASHSRNCKTICKIKEGFTGGLCKRGSCRCTATCGTHGTHSLSYNVVPVEKTLEVEGEIDGEIDNASDVEKF